MIRKIYKPIIYICIIAGLFLGVFAVSVDADEGEREIRAIRKILIVSQGQTEEGISMAKELGVSEVAEGIPSALKNKVTEDMLPYVYEEIIYEEKNELDEEMKKALKKLGADIAEYYPVLDESIEAGDVVSVLTEGGLISGTSTKYLIEKSSQPYDSKLMGVISSNSAMMLNSAGDADSEATLRPIALTGRVPVKVSLENGPIEIGDYLTSSAIAGIAMKATRPGQTIGMALEPLTEVDSQLAYGMIMVFVNVGWWEGDFIEISEEGGFSFSNLFTSILEQFKKMGVFIQQNLVRVQRLITAALVIEQGPTPEESTIGQGMVLSGTTEVIIYNNNVTPTSKIFITFRGDYQGRWWASEIGEGYFKIALSEVPLQNTPFDYWIVGVEEGWMEELVEEVPADELVSEPVDEPICENGTNRACSTEIGACQIGVEICEQGVWGKCIGAVFPTEEICDEVDNDCDGEVDEDNACGGSSEPEPEPTTTTTEPIIEPEPEPEATSTEPVCEPTSEICDGIDNDCDGLVDEELIQPCGSSDVGTCQFGSQTCLVGIWGECVGVVEPVEEICDGIDNDCDDLIDEDVDCGVTSCDPDGSLHLTGECQNSCWEESCQICTPTCVCLEGFLDCDGDIGNGCEIATSTCPIIE